MRTCSSAEHGILVPPKGELAVGGAQRAPDQRDKDLQAAD